MDDPLAALQPLHPPPAVSWWPPAPGWWLLLLMLGMLILLLLWWRKPTAAQRVALTELRALSSSAGQPARQAAALNQLLKRYALACFPGSGVEALTGESWLKFLDAHGGNGGFLRGSGRALLTAPYSKDAGPVQSLAGLVESWIRANRPRGGR